MNNIIVKNSSWNNKDFINLCNELDSFLNEAIGGDNKRKKYIKYNAINTMDYVLIAYDSDLPVGCAALRTYTDSQIELKRVYVRSDYRKRNIGGMLLEHLISWAKNANYQYMLLETGEFLTDSIKLYKRFGFWKIDNYGNYINMPESLCMGLSLSADSITYCLGKTLSASQISSLFCSVNWESGRYPELLEKGFRNAGTVISAFQANTLIGLVEVLDDGAAVAYVHYLLVRPSHQNQQIGAHLMEMVKEIYSNYISLVVIAEKPQSLPFYNRLGFRVLETATPLGITCF